VKTYLFRKSDVPPESVNLCRTDLVALDLLPDFLSHRFFISYRSHVGDSSWPAFLSTFGYTI